jgi:hypothetical protein
MLAGCTATTTAPPRTESAAIPQQDDPETSDVAEDEEPTGFIEICVSKKTRVRVSYRGCDDARPGVTWYFLPLDAKVPATGSKAKRGSFKQPRGDSYRAPEKGGIGSDVMLADVDDRVEVCVLKKTRTRVSDIRCDDEKGYAWYYIRIEGGHVPSVGKTAEDGSFRSPYAEAYRARRSGGDAAAAAQRL